MTTLTQLELACPACGQRFQSQKVLTTNSFGGKRTDFHERAAGTQPLPYLVHGCYACGFTGPESWFDGDGHTEVHREPTLVEQLREALQSFATRETTGSARYEAAALTGTILGEEYRTVADLYLRAAWCCVDEGDSEAERYFRIKAVRGFIAALGAFDMIEKPERAVITYLVGELWRRIGDLKVARWWFDHVSEEVTDQKTQQWIIDAAIQQRDCPREWWG